MAQLAREQFFDAFAENDANFAGLIYTKSGYNKTEVRKNLISILYSLEWPEYQGQPIPYRYISRDMNANIIIGNLFATIDFLERNLGVSVDIFDVRTGCVKVRYLYDVNVHEFRLIQALRVFREVMTSYDAFYISATFAGRSVKVY